MKMKYFYLLICSIFLVGCSAKKNLSSSVTKEEAANLKWQLVELVNKPIAAKINDKVPVLSLDNDHYSLITGCNTLNGGVNWAGSNKIKFSHGMSTMMYCEDMSVEDGFKSIVEDINTFAVEGNFLLLKNNKGEVLAKFKKVEDSANNSLVNTTWTLDLLSVPGVDFKATFIGQKPTLSFGDDMNIFGNSSCNNYRSNIKIDGNSIHLGPIMSTKMMCANIKAEEIYLETLKKINRFSVSNNVMTLLIDDIAVMRFVKN